MNLLPWRESLEKMRTFTVIFYGVLMLVVAIHFSFIVNTIMKYAIQKTNAQIQQKNFLLSSISVQTIQQRALLQKNLAGLFLNAQYAIQQNITLDHALKAIAMITPSTITLSTLTLSKNSCVISGDSISIDAIHAYSDALSKTFVSHSVSLSDIHQKANNQSLFCFTLKAIL